MQNLVFDDLNLYLKTEEANLEARILMPLSEDDVNKVYRLMAYRNFRNFLTKHLTCLDIIWKLETERN